MYEKLDVLITLLHKAKQLDNNNLESLPKKHRTTSLDIGSTDTISYHQGYRNGIQSIKAIIQIMHDNAQDEFEKESERIYLEDLRQRCADIIDVHHMIKIDLGHMNRKECIAFLKDKGVWKEPKKTRER